MSLRQKIGRAKAKVIEMKLRTRAAEDYLFELESIERRRDPINESIIKLKRLAACIDQKNVEAIAREIDKYRRGII